MYRTALSHAPDWQNFGVRRSVQSGDREEDVSVGRRGSSTCVCTRSSRMAVEEEQQQQ